MTVRYLFHAVLRVLFVYKKINEAIRVVPNYFPVKFIVVPVNYKCSNPFEMNISTHLAKDC